MGHLILSFSKFYLVWDFVTIPEECEVFEASWKTINFVSVPFKTIKHNLNECDTGIYFCNIEWYIGIQ